MKLIHLILVISFSLISSSLIGQGVAPNERFFYEDKMDDPYLPPSNKAFRKTKAFEVVSDNFFCTQVNIDSSGANILNDAANEPSLSINPLNPNEMVIGWRQFDNINSNFRQAGFGFTTDGGLTWTSPDPIEPGVFRSDPVLRADDEGRMYYNSLTFVESTNEIFCHTYISEEIGLWDEGTFAFGGDKQWMAIGKTGTGAPRIYLTWSPAFSICDGSFTQSLDGGASYTECVDAEFDTFLGTINIGKDNNLYAAGWHLNQITLRVSDGTRDSLHWARSRVVNIDGSLAVRNGPNPGGLLGQVDIETDLDNSDDEHYVYILSSVVPNSGLDPCDLMFVRSTDGGLSFESPIKINTDASNNNYQWFGTMSVAPNDRIDVVWLDTRDQPGSFLSALYYSFSQDHGETWSANQKLTESFDPHVGWPNQPKMGDYFDMKSSDAGAHLAWCGTFNGEQDVYYAFIQPQEVTTSLNEVVQLEDMIDLKLLPNPSASLPSLEVTSRLSLDVAFRISNVQGKLLGEGSVHLQGKQNISLEHSLNLNTPLKSGVYFLQLSSKGFGIAIEKIIIL